MDTDSEEEEAGDKSPPASNETEEPEEIPRWMRYLPKKRYSKRHGPVIAHAVDNGPGDDQLLIRKGKRKRSESVDMDTMEDDPTAPSSHDIDYPVSETASRRRRRSRGVLFVEYVDPTAAVASVSTSNPSHTSSDSTPNGTTANKSFHHKHETSISDRPTDLPAQSPPYAAPPDGITLLFGEDNRCDSTKPLVKRSRVSHSSTASGTKNVSITEASLLLELSMLE